MRILFLIPEIRIARYTLPFWLKRLNPPESPHLGVAQLCEILKQNGHLVKVIDLQLKNKAYANRIIKKFKPNVIGFTITSYCTEKVYNHIRKIKEQHPRTPIMVGGAHPSCVGKDVLKQCEKIDFAVVGEGEQTIIELLNAIKKNKGFSDIDGLGWRKNGEIIANKPRKFIDNLDEVPFPKYHEFNLPKYQDWKQNSISMITSRGCPFSCVYCSVFQSMGKKFRVRTAENVVKEIEYWHKRGIKKFNFNDDCFTLKPKRVEEICDLILKKKLKIEYRLYNGIRVDLLTKELVHKMKLAGCTSTSLGIETGNEETMRHIKKNINFDQVFKAIKWLKEEKIATVGNFIIGHPYETYEKGLDTIKMSEKIETDYINFNNVIPYPGTELFDWIKTHGKFTISPEVYLNNVSGKRMKMPLFETKDFSVKEREKLLKKGVYNFRKRYIRSKVRKPFSEILVYLAKSDIAFGLIETAKNMKIFTIIKKSLMK